MGEENGCIAGTAPGAAVGGSITCSREVSGTPCSRRGREVARWLLLVLWLEWWKALNIYPMGLADFASGSVPPMLKIKRLNHVSPEQRLGKD